MSPPGHAREARYVTSPKPVKSPLFESARKKPTQHPLTQPNRVLYAVNHLHATTHAYYPAACNNSHPLSGCMRQLQPDNHVYTMLYRSSAFILYFRTTSFRIARIQCAIRENNGDIPYGVFLWVHHRSRTRFENKRLSFPGLNSWSAIGGIRD